MSVRNLDFLFSPRSVAVVGVSAKPGNLGGIVLRNLLEGGFRGPVLAVGLRAATVHGVPVHAGVGSLAHAPDLAVICTPAPSVPALIAELGAKGTRAAIVLTAGLSAPGPDGRPLRDAMLEAARPHLLRILGPNCLGALVPAHGLNASFAPSAATAGGLAFVTQSGALATAMLDWANTQGIGFSHYVSLGDSADVDFGDMLDHLASDGSTRAILLYMEAVKHARKFMSAARAAARNKPVIVVKSGRAPEGARAAASHTGALAGSDDVFEAAVRRAGMLRVHTLEELFDAAATLARPMPWRGERLAIVTNGGGAGVLAADALALAGGRLASLEAATLERLRAVLPPSWAPGNPVDIIGDAPVQRYVDALRIVIEAPEVDGVLFLHAPAAIVPSADIAKGCVPLLLGASKPVLSTWLGGRSVAAAREAFVQAGLASYATPEQAVAGWMQLVLYHRNQQALLQLPDECTPDVVVDRAGAQAILDEAVRSRREWLDEAQAKALLRAYGIPTVRTEHAATEDDAVRAAQDIGFPVALKVVSAQIQHKSDAGGVALDLAGEQDVRAAIARMRDSVAAKAPGARIDGFSVQQMARKAHARELILGIAHDAVFGPVLMFGEGGTAVELNRDRTLELPPLDAPLARAMVARTRVARLLAGFRGSPAADERALVDALLRVSRIACDLPAVAELDINPLLAGSDGVIALDARIRVRKPAAGEGSRLALRPYPSHLQQVVEHGGTRLLLRPVRPDDAARLLAFYAAAPASDLRLRFFHSRREVPRSELARFCQIDYEREMAFVALDGERMAGEVRAVCDPDNVVAEFAIHVAHDWQRRGLGKLLLDRMLAYLRSRGTREVVGWCLKENWGMQALARRCGFSVDHPAGDSCRLALDLSGTASESS
jgi:acetyltransferase